MRPTHLCPRCWSNRTDKAICDACDLEVQDECLVIGGSE